MANADIWKSDSYLFAYGSPPLLGASVNHSSFISHPGLLFCTVFFFLILNNRFAVNYHGTLQNEDLVSI